MKGSKNIGSKIITYDMGVSRKVSANTRHLNFKDKTALNCIVVNLLSAERKGQALCYSRNTSHKSSGKKKLNARRIISAINFLVDEGWIVNYIGKGHRIKEKRIMSEVKSTRKFATFVNTDLEMTEEELMAIEDDKYEWTSSVEIREREEKALIKYERVAIEDMEATVVALNKINNRAMIVDGDGVVLENEYCRIFSRDLEHGGRWYKADILGIKNRDTKARLDVTIDGEQVVEIDYRSLHFRIAAAMEGLGLDEFPDDVYGHILRVAEVYDATEVDHRVIKTSVNLMFNCNGETQAVRAITSLVNSLSKEDRLKYNLGTGRAVLNMVFDAVPIISTKMCGGIEDYGMKLQNADSYLAEDIIKVFVEQGKPILPVHDSFVVKYKDMDLLLDSMGGKFRERFGVDYLIPVRMQYKLDGVIMTDDVLV